MAGRQNPSFLKRQKEQKRKDRALEKREARRARRAARAAGTVLPETSMPADSAEGGTDEATEEETGLAT